MWESFIVPPIYYLNAMEKDKNSVRMDSPNQKGRKSDPEKALVNETTNNLDLTRRGAIKRVGLFSAGSIPAIASISQETAANEVGIQSHTVDVYESDVQEEKLKANGDIISAMELAAVGPDPVSGGSVELAFDWGAWTEQASRQVELQDLSLKIAGVSDNPGSWSITNHTLYQSGDGINIPTPVEYGIDYMWNAATPAPSPLSLIEDSGGVDTRYEDGLETLVIDYNYLGGIQMDEVGGVYLNIDLAPDSHSASGDWEFWGLLTADLYYATIEEKVSSALATAEFTHS